MVEERNQIKEMQSIEFCNQQIEKLKRGKFTRLRFVASRLGK